MFEPRAGNAQGGGQQPVQYYIDPNFPNPGGKWDTRIIIYGYTPSFALAVFAVAWFLLLSVIHTALTIRTRRWWWIPVSVGLIFEVVGYIARCLSAKQDPYHLIYFILNYFFIVTAPVFLAAGIYTTLTVLINQLGRTYSFLPPKFILAFFITTDAVATILQVAGAALIGKAESDRKDPTPGNNILLGGLAWQVFSIGVFIILGVSFVWRARHQIRKNSLVTFTATFSIATLLIYMRTIFRLAETAEGLMSTLQTNEVYFACLEFMPVALALLLLAIWHPGRHVNTTVTERDVDDSTSDIKEGNAAAVFRV
ncbi:hypothetical protein QQS21_011372 [Conoideocrella luteorostrata]|uniref:RTA1 like protein n=1 Tax=Conoideocrella luteorostrata TaxID=1105319 RepID=A0AAJ0FTT2_9HYPO|nr:hypothetical protein QQS21_011372 [Conoideocrella luteorostrata]